MVPKRSSSPFTGCPMFGRSRLPVPVVFLLVFTVAPRGASAGLVTWENPEKSEPVNGGATRTCLTARGWIGETDKCVECADALQHRVVR